MRLEWEIIGEKGVSKIKYSINVSGFKASVAQSLYIKLLYQK